MPWKQPGFLAEVLQALSAWWSAYAYAPFVAFLVAVVRGAIAGHPKVKTILEGILFALMTVALRPLLAYLGLAEDLALFIGAFTAFLGAKWIRENIDAFTRRWIEGGRK